MISIVICSANPRDLSRVKQSIEITIGVPFELLDFDNNVLKKGICEIYNMGARQASYDIICFMHEDIEMITVNWGQKLVDIFRNNAGLGLLGVAGGGYKSVVPSSWYNADLELNGAFYCCLMQGFKYSGKEEFLDYRNPRNEKLSKVASIDGCWMCTRKSIAEQHPFDEKLLTGFHAYDIDFSLATGTKYEVAVTYEILLRHFSEGAFSKDWEDAILKVHEKWSAILPVNTDELNEAHLLRNERKAFKAFHNRQLDQGSSYGRLAEILWKSRKSRIFAGGKWYKLYVDLWRVWKKRG
ncbi:glycosyltransferase [Dyadobacter crusticola]|uniref:glycosyltransferase n=1 Tax=Dyadobacter crusticola TaxID=292407 RepID=UPI00068E4708|nr:glycosyltransferase [Dyadobacter crusticola]